MSRRVQVVLLCEDSQQAAFARRFLKRDGWNLRGLRVVKAPQGRGAGEQFVREQFPREVAEQRRRHVAQTLVVLIDGDVVGVEGRKRSLRDVCDAHDVVPPTPAESVAVFVPTRNIETWFAYLDGQEVDEATNYPRLVRERACHRHVDVLAKMCRQRQLRQPAPPSLVAACREYTRLSAVRP